MNFLTIRLSKTNCYLLPAGNGYMMIDCGYEYDKDLLEKKLKKLKISYNDIKVLLLTHHHDDHSGLTNFITSQNPQIKVLMHILCRDLISTGMNERAANGGWCSSGAKFIAGTYHRFHPEWTLTFPPYLTRDIDYLIEDENDDILQQIGIDVRIIFTPGHTPDSISVLDSSGNLFCGDAAANFLKWAGTGYSPFYISDLNQYYRSWEKIIKLNVKTIYPSHGSGFPVSKLIRNRWKIKQLSAFTWD